MAAVGLIGRVKASVLKGRLERRESANQTTNAKLQAGVQEVGVGWGCQAWGKRKFSEQKKTLPTLWGNPLIAQ